MRTILLSVAASAALCAVQPALAQEHTGGAVSACDSSSATGECSSGNSWDNAEAYTADGDNRGRVRRTQYNPDARPYANFQTSDVKFNAIMNRIANQPGVNSCLTQEERWYVQDYVGYHPEMADAVAAHDLSQTCR